MKPARPRLYGPKKVPKTGQVALPRELMRELSILPGESVYLLAWKGRVLMVREDDVAARLEDLFRDLATAD